VVVVLGVLAGGYVLATSASPTAVPSPSGTSASSEASPPATSASSAASLPGLDSGPPPWSPESANLRARLEAIGLPVLSAESEVLHTHQHLDVLIDGQPVTVPADIGINATEQYLAPIHTHDATGIIHVESPVVRDFTLGEFFDIWGVRLDAHCVGGECDGNGRTLAVYVNGQPVEGDPRAVKLESHQEIVVALGTPAQLPSPIPASYAFPSGL
jgi:hypothetical protein